MSSTPRARRFFAGGFTLIELMVGLVLAGAAVSLGYGTFATLVDGSGRAQERLNADMRAAAIRGRLVEWLGSVSATGTTGSRLLTGVDLEEDGVPADQVTLLASPGTIDLGGPLDELRIYVDHDPATPEEGLSVEWTDPRTGMRTRTMLAGEVMGLEVRYLTGVLGGRRWVPSWISTTVLPVGMEVVLISAPGAALHPLLAMPIHVFLEQGR